MRTSPYENDLREKVIEYLASGKSQRSAEKVFNISLSTVNRWSVRQKRQGHVKAKVRPGKAPSVEAEAIHAYVKSNPKFKASEMGAHFNMTAAGALYWLKKLGYTYKKKRLPIWKQTEKSERTTKPS